MCRKLPSGMSPDLSKFPAAAHFPPLVSWQEFQSLPEQSDDCERYELHDGQVVIVPIEHPFQLYLRTIVCELLRFVEEHGFVVGERYPYRPAPNHQFWTAAVAVLPETVVEAMQNWTEYEVYAPPVIVEMLSPLRGKVNASNTPDKISCQRIVAMSNGTREFWVVNADNHTVLVTTSDGVKLYGAGDSVPVSIMPGQSVSVDRIFARS
jgi:Uma2 family endonuclease